MKVDVLVDEDDVVVEAARNAEMPVPSGATIVVPLDFRGTPKTEAIFPAVGRTSVVPLDLSATPKTVELKVRAPPKANERSWSFMTDKRNRYKKKPA